MAKSGTKVDTEGTAAPEEAPKRREIVEVDSGDLQGLRGTGGGRTRTPTEFDDQITEWAAADKLKVIPIDGADDAKYVYNAVKRAVDAHNEDNPDSPLGIDRTPTYKDDNGKHQAVKIGDEKVKYVVVRVRPKQKRGPAVGSARINSKVYGPGEWHWEGDTKVPNADATPESNGDSESEPVDY